MGISGHVTIPAVGRTRARGANLLAAAWMSDEWRPTDALPRFLVSIFLRDCPGVLRQVLTVLDDGVAFAPPLGDTPPRTARFTVDGSMSSSIGSAFVLALVVHPIYEGSSTTPAPPELVRQPLERALQVGLENYQCSIPVDLAPRIKISHFEALDDFLFKDRQFTEYRFGIERSISRTTRILGRVTAAFASNLAEEEVPIAYLYFPDTLTGGAENIDWVRMGLGAPPHLVDHLDVDLAALRIAKTHGCILKKYAPNLIRESMSERFLTIADGRRPTTAGHPADVDHYDVVYAEGPARTGYVAAMLEGAVDAPMGGSMTVLAGHTVCCWLVPPGEGDALASHIRSVDPKAVETERARVEADTIPAGSLEERGDYLSYWIGWSSLDRPGVLRGLLDKLQVFVRDAYDGHEDCIIDVRYAVSRVLADGKRCAGKLNFLLPAPAAEGFDRQLDVAKSAFAKALGFEGGSETALVIRRDEPGEEPWASLLVEG
ncbi:MAG TPA: hypothetical protein VF711_11345 [Acidimicrobiales bacterium]|jgi:hypothetical protein